MRLLLSIILAAILTGCTLHQQPQRSHLDQTTVPQEPRQQAPKPQYKVEGDWIIGPRLKWPLKGSDGRWGTLSRDGSGLLWERWKNGTEARLAAADMAAVRTLVFKQLPDSNRKITAIKQISEREYMVEGRWYADPEGAGELLFVVVRNEDEWALLAHYYIRIS